MMSKSAVAKEPSKSELALMILPVANKEPNEADINGMNSRKIEDATEELASGSLAVDFWREPPAGRYPKSSKTKDAGKT
ncbi:MAG: hypothetical protein SGBAC_011149 [Bacillariaceae sp.]